MDDILLEQILNESKEVVALYGGGFKPPTAGHFLVVKKALEDNPDIDVFKVLVGGGSRDGIEQHEAVLAWEIFSEYLPMKVEVIPAKNPPIKEIYNFAKENPEKTVYFVIGGREGREDDVKDIAQRTKGMAKYQNVSVKAITTPDGGMSGTNARLALKKGDEEEFYKFLPTELSDEQKNEIFQMMIPNVSEELNEGMLDKYLIALKSKFKDFVKGLKQEGKETKEAFLKVVNAVKSGEKLSKEDRTEIGNQLKDTLKLAGFTAASVLPGGVIYLLLTRIPALKTTLTPSSFINEDIIEKTDYVLPRGKKVILQAEDKDYNRGLIVELLDNGGYEMAYWYDKPNKPYPVEILVDGQSIKPDGEVVEMKFHPQDYYDEQDELNEGRKKKTQRLKKQKNENVAPNHDGKAAPFGSGYEPLKEVDFVSLEKKLDDLFYDLDIDVNFTKHFKERVLQRNLSEEDVLDLAKKIIDKYEDRVTYLDKDENVVFTHLSRLVDIAVVSAGYGEDFLKDLVFKTAFKRQSPAEPEFRTNVSSPKLKVNEGRYDTITNQISGEIFNYWKKNIKDQDLVTFEKSYKHEGESIDVEASIKLSSDVEYLKVDGGADDEFDFIAVRFEVNPNALPNAWEEISFNLKDVIRHEIEHLTHGEGFLLKPGKHIPDDTALRQMIDIDLLPQADYFKLEKEIDANLQGMYFRAKKEKRPLKDVVNVYLNAQDITPEEKIQIIDLWDKRTKALSLPSIKENINENATYSNHIDYKQEIIDLTKHMLEKGMNIKPLPQVVFKHDDQDNAQNFLGKTAYYDPNNMTIVLYTEGRHPKDIVRSFSHEMIHHIQNLEGRLKDINTTNTLEDDYLNDIEREAYSDGNMTFRNYTDNKDGVESSSLNEKKKKDLFGLNAYARELAKGLEEELNSVRIPEEEVVPSKEKVMNYKIYSDMDGVLVDFDKRFMKFSKGITPGDYKKKYGDKGFWDLVDNQTGVRFWRGMDYMSDGETYWNYISKYNPIFLSSPSRSETSRIGKRMWVKDNHPDTKLVLAQAFNKKNYADENAILIDDRKSNIEQWEAAGGIGILHTSASDTIKQLKALGL